MNIKIFIFILLLFLSIVVKDLSSQKLKSPNYIEQNSTLKEKIQNKEIIYDIIKAINHRNSKIKNIEINSVKMLIKQNTTVNATGKILYQKDKDFRLIVNSLFGKEMDIGSNNTYFWYWSRRMNPPNIFYAKHSNLNKTMLKTPLNPEWIMESLALNSIDIENIEIGKLNNNWVVLQNRKDAQNESVIIATLIDSNTKVLGNYLYNSKGKMVASTEILEHTTHQEAIMPKILFITWYEEGITMKWELLNIKTNLEIQENNWELPSFANQTELSNSVSENPKIDKRRRL